MPSGILHMYVRRSVRAFHPPAHRRGGGRPTRARGAAQARQTRAQFSNWLCHEASGVCKAKAPPLPAGRTPGPAFEVIDPKEAELEKMLAGMKARAHAG
jgi:hypothetical protein